MFKRAFTLATILLQLGCADPIDNAKKTVEAQLTHKEVVNYRNLKVFPADVVCGEISGVGRWGEGGAYKRFIARDDQAEIAASDDDWDIFCSEDPAAQLQARFGIGPVNRQNTQLMTVHRQLGELSLALEQYLSVYQAYPMTTPGLQSLLSTSTTEPQIENGKKAGYIDKIPEDPWGRPYLYEKIRRLHPAPQVYKLQTLGRDGVKGGQGEDADIGNRHLKYLDHISNL